MIRNYIFIPSTLKRSAQGLVYIADMIKFHKNEYEFRSPDPDIGYNPVHRDSGGRGGKGQKHILPT